MRWWVCAAVVAAFLHGPTASAQVTEDLVFCSKLNNSRERLACYDAAARLARRHTRPAPSADIVDERPTARSGLTKKASSFDGPYVFGGAGVTIGSSSNAYSLVPDSQELSGSQWHAGLGLNKAVGPLLLGTEARVFAGNFSRERTYGSLPSIYAFAARPYGGLYGTSLVIAGSHTNTGRLELGASADLTLRAGLTLGEGWLVFTRAGGGVTRARTTTYATDYALVCTSPILTDQTTFIDPNIKVFSGCNGTRLDKQTYGFGSTTSWAPYLVFGAGSEKNLGPFFVRSEFELQSYVSLQSFSLRAMGAVGYRF